ncbi:MAG: hypothetical protein M1482_03235 [Chloroflexi bacterium]|nr:hypothetical protein [Chloroflexota bacterium]
MARYILALFVTGAILAVVTAAAVSAQEADPADEVKAFLTAKGYSVDEAGFVDDDQGRPRPDAVYVLMDAVTADLDHPDLQAQVVWGFSALRQAYPRVENLFVTLAYRQYWILFRSTGADLDQFVNQTLSGAAYWNQVRGQVRIYDRVKKTYTDEKDFTTNNQAGKDETGKDYGSTPDNPVPTPVPAGVQGGVLWLEPSTVYLPNDASSPVVMMATLLDGTFGPLANRRLDFSYQAPGDSAQSAGSQMTDANGSARASVAGSRAFNSLLLRAGTQDLTSQASIVVGTAPVHRADQIAAVERGLTKQGYAGVKADYTTDTRATGETVNRAWVEMRLASEEFDRTAYSQLSRAFGTLRTLLPKANELYVSLIFRKDDRDWELLWQAQAAHWDQLVAGQIGESDFWRSLDYVGTFDDHGNRVEDKNFLDKNFGAGTGGAEARVTRTLESTVTRETWGDQWHGQEFIILPGSYADTFAVDELSGSADGIEIFESPDFVTPVLTYKHGDSPDRLQMRLGQGQYLFAVTAASSPASARVNYVEHLRR